MKWLEKSNVSAFISSWWTFPEVVDLCLVPLFFYAIAKAMTFDRGKRWIATAWGGGYFRLHRGEVIYRQVSAYFSFKIKLDLFFCFFGFRCHIKGCISNLNKVIQNKQIILFCYPFLFSIWVYASKIWDQVSEKTDIRCWQKDAWEAGLTFNGMDDWHHVF